MPELLTLPSDSATRRAYMPESARRHPGKLHLGFLAHLLNTYTHPGMVLLDPLAGAGSLLYACFRPWACNVVLNELELQWVRAQQATRAYHESRFSADRPVGWALHLCADASKLTLHLGWLADAIFCSPPYGDALTHQRHQQDYSQEPTTAHWHSTESAQALRRGYDAPTDGTPPTPGVRNPAQIGNLRGKRYAVAMAAVWATCVPLVKPGGPVIVILKNTVKHNQAVDLVGLTRGQLEALGCTYETAIPRAVRPGGFHNMRAKRATKLGKTALIIDREWALIMRAPS